MEHEHGSSGLGEQEHDVQDEIFVGPAFEGPRSGTTVRVSVDGSEYNWVEFDGTQPACCGGEIWEHAQECEGIYGEPEATD